MLLTVTVADSWAEGGGRGDVLPVGCLEACLLLPLLVPLLHLALAHPAGGQRDDVITRCYSSCRRTKDMRKRVIFSLRHIRVFHTIMMRVKMKQGGIFYARKVCFVWQGTNITSRYYITKSDILSCLQDTCSHTV